MNTELIRRATQQLQTAEDSPNFEIELAKSDSINTLVEVLQNTPVYKDANTSSDVLWEADAGDKYKLIDTSYVSNMYRILTRVSDGWIPIDKCKLHHPIVYAFNSLEENQQCEVLSIDIRTSRDTASSTATIKFANADSIIPINKIKSDIIDELIIEPDYKATLLTNPAQFRAYYKSGSQKTDVTELCQWSTNGSGQIISKGTVTGNTTTGRSTITAVYKDKTDTAILCVTNKQVAVDCPSLKIYFKNTGGLQPLGVSFNGTTLKSNWTIPDNADDYIEVQLQPGDNELRFTNYGYLISMESQVPSVNPTVDLLTGNNIWTVETKETYLPSNATVIWNIIYNPAVLNTDQDKFYITPKVLVTKPWSSSLGSNITLEFNAFYKENGTIEEKSLNSIWNCSSGETITNGVITNPTIKGVHTITATYNTDVATSSLIVCDEKLELILPQIKIKIKSSVNDYLSGYFNGRNLLNNTLISTDFKTYLLNLNTGINVLQLFSNYGDTKFNGIIQVCDINENVIQTFNINLDNSEFILVFTSRNDQILAFQQDNISDSIEIGKTSYASEYLKDLVSPENIIKIKLGYGDILENLLVGAIDKVSIDSNNKMLTIECRDNMRYLTDQTIDPVRYGKRITFPNTDNLVQFINNPTVNFKNRAKFYKTTVLKLGPSTKYKTIATLSSGELPLLGTVKGWYAVLYKGKTVYVYSKDVKVVQIPQELATGITYICNEDTSFKLKPDVNEPTYVVIKKGERLPFAGIYNGTWSRVYFKNQLGYVVTAKFNAVATESLWNQINSDIDLSKTYTRASSVIEHLAVLGTTIDHDEDNMELSRNICNYIGIDPDIKDEFGDQLDYTIKNISFSYDMTYYDAIMQVANDMGNVWFRCDRFGNLVLSPIPIANKNDEPDWYISDYVDLTDSKMDLDSTDIRNKVIVTSPNGMEMYEHVGITNYLTKGVNRIAGIESKWATTSEQRREVARNFFYQILSYYKKLSIAIRGNPLIEVGHMVRVKDKTYGVEEDYVVREITHTFDTNGFTTRLELDYIPDVDDDAIRFITDEFPTNIKKFQYTLQFKGKPLPLNMNMGHTIEKAKIRIYDMPSGDLLTELFIVPEVVTSLQTPAPTTKTYVVLNSNGVNIRTTPSTSINTNIKRKENKGFKAEYVATEGKWYKIKDPKDGKFAYIWASFCTTRKETIPAVKNANLVATGDVQKFINLVESKVGCGYAWGAMGETLSSDRFRALSRSFGASKLNPSRKWLGKQVFDCSGLVSWTLNEMGIIKKMHYTAQQIYDSLCYPISKSQLQPGDLCFTKKNGKITHVAVYIGNDKIVGAQNSNEGVVEKSMYSQLNVYGRLRKLSAKSVVPATVVDPLGATVSRKYSVFSTYDSNLAPKAVKDKASSLHGNVLCYAQNCVLYNVEIASYQGSYNVIRLRWAPTVTTNQNLNLYYEYITY